MEEVFFSVHNIQPKQLLVRQQYAMLPREQGPASWRIH